MDPVSALGVAAASLQFLDASVKAYNTFQEIRSGAESTTERNKQLEYNVRSAQSLRASLASTSAPHAATDPVSKLTTTCILKADELLTLLEYVRGSRKKISSTRATVRALLKQRDIEKLYSSIKEDQDSLNQMISHKLLPSIDFLTVQQSKEFASIDSVAQELIKGQIEQRKAQIGNHTIVKNTLDSVQYGLQLHVDETNRSITRGKLLKSLWFPQIDQRRNEIKEPAPSTLDWLFKSTSYTGSDSNAKWSNFRQWLREDTSTYWISGKAGSGKSTLMAHIVDDERTRKDLDTWSGGYRLEVLSFFFWRAGSQLQNSVLGLLRSLLYQLCVLQPAIADNISDRFTSVGIPAWTERNLLTYITQQIRSSQGFRFCIFIDGIDEYRGPYDDAVDYISQLQDFGNVKVCVSSRPELELVHRFRVLKQLRLQDLNWDDITKFVKQSLAKTQLSESHCKELTEAVVGRAEGVFLWASLVTQSLVKGAKAGDDQYIMWKRLDSLPGNMNQLFQQMLSDVDPVYRKSLAFYLQLMRFSDENPTSPALATIPIITTTQLNKRINSYEEFANECERTETQIATQSAGLLEIYSPPILGIHRARKGEWEEAKIKHVSNRPDFMLKPEDLDRRRCPKDEPYPAMLDYEYRLMKWIHRSAYEFLSNQIENKTLLLELSIDHQELLRQMGEGWISYIMAAPSYYTRSDVWEKPLLTRSPTLVDRLEHFISVVSEWQDVYPTTISTLLDHLYSVCVHIKDSNELSGGQTREWFYLNIDNYTGKIMFWSACAAGALWPYIMSRMDRVLKETICDSLIAHILACSLCFRGLMHKPQDLTDIDRFTNSLAEVLLQHTVEKLECSGIAQAIEYKRITKENDCLRDSVFSCATWKEPATEGFMNVMMGLIQWLDAAWRGIILYQTEPVSVPASLSTLMAVSDLYVAPDLALNRIYIQVSATAWTTLYSSGGLAEYGDTIGHHVSAVQVGRAVRILCVPSLKKRKLASRKNVFGGYYGSEVPWDPVMERESSRFIVLQPSTATSDRLLGLLAYGESKVDFKFGMTGNKHERREVCEMLLEEIKSAEQDLDGGQQLIAAACVRAGLLDPNIEDIPLRSRPHRFLDSDESY